MKTLVGAFSFLSVFLSPMIRAQSVTIDPRSSLVITDHKILNEIVKTYDFGALYGEVGIWTGKFMEWNMRAKEREAGWRQRWGAGTFVYQSLLGAVKEQENHQELFKNARTRGQALGGPYDSDRTLRYVLNTWASQVANKNLNDSQVKNLFDSKVRVRDLKASPFRLLAIVNRMDLAGDMDDRGTTHTTSFPRSLGELHLVYGFVDEKLEKKGKVYPGVFVMSYRLPSLKWQDGILVDEFVENTRDPKGSMMAMNNNYIRLIDHKIPDNKKAWTYKMHLWADMWADLSKHKRGSEKFNEKLAKLLDRVVQPRNFLQLRSNTQVNNKEFELREWYILQTSQTLITRKPRDEVYRCQSGQEELTKVVNYFWNPKDNDLDMRSRSLYARQLSGGKDGYTIPRDGGTDSGEVSNGGRTALLEVILHDPSNPNRDRITSFSNCGDTLVRNSTPFEMASEGNDVVQGSRAVLTPPMARVDKDHVWKLASRVMGKKTQFYEEKRHAFAIRTCSGCHGAEAATFGFHIEPRTANQDSMLSGFMTGVGRNTFRQNGVKYEYNELAKRKDWLLKSLNKEAKLFDSLVRKDAK